MPVAHGWHQPQHYYPTKRSYAATPKWRRPSRCSGAGWSQVGEPGLSLFQYGVIRRARTAAESSGCHLQLNRGAVRRLSPRAPELTQENPAAGRKVNSRVAGRAEGSTPFGQRSLGDNPIGRLALFGVNEKYLSRSRVS